MKSWHIIVLDGCRTVIEREIFNVKDANELFEEWKEKYAALNLEEEVKARAAGTKPIVYAVKREWY